ncbi:MAG: hypothetical protein KKC20_15210, partial [Proteobacteria bacterium]|nr:hypothetical protein [Pseudomonadota bacterium]
RDLEKGVQTLSSLLGKRVSPVFTPPWNRCGETCLSSLKNLGFKAVSMDTNASSPGPGLLELPVHVDLHTRKETSPEQGWQSLFMEMLKGLGSGQCGIMIHHQKMTAEAFTFLSFLLQEINCRKKISPLTFDALIAREDRWRKE